MGFSWCQQVGISSVVSFLCVFAFFVELDIEWRTQKEDIEKLLGGVRDEI